MEPTIINKNEQLNAVLQLSELELEAVRMRYRGSNLKEIAEKARVAYGTARGWFMVGGKLNKTYRNYSKAESKFRIEQARNLFKGELVKSIQVLVKLLDDPQPRVRFLAAKEIILRELGEPPKQIFVNDERDPAREILLAMGLVEEEKEELLW